MLNGVMKIKLENRTNLEELAPKREWEVELPEGSTVGDLLSELDLDRLEEEDGSISDLVTMEKNKEEAVHTVDEDLEDGDKIKIMPRLMR